MRLHQPTPPTHHPTPRKRPRRRFVRTLLGACLLAVLASTTLTTAASATAIDPWPHYVPQSTCSPTPKPGTVKLAAWLQATYPGTGSDGISRACDSGGTSEHKEGRAFDWRVDATNPHEKREAMRFLHRAFATDAAGHKAALARRMGIMYAIFDDKIYSATYHYRARPYKNAGCRTIRSCSPTLRHRDHMHISLTWPGARAQTSWYDHTPSQPTPHQPNPHQPSPHQPSPHQPGPHQPSPPDPGHDGGWHHDHGWHHDGGWHHTHGGHDGGSGDPRDGGHSGPQVPVYLPGQDPLEVTVPGDGRARRTPQALHEGSVYKLTVFGLYRYGEENADVSDAACVWNPTKQDWVARPAADVRDAHGTLQLTINGHKLDVDDCHPRDHVYQVRYTATRTDQLRLRLDNTTSHSLGRVHVAVTAPDAPARTLVPARRPQAAPPQPRPAQVSDRVALEDYVNLDETSRSVTSTDTLEAGVTYRITVAGLVRLEGETYTDGQCLFTDGRWEQHASLDLATPGVGHGTLYVNGVPFDGAAPAEDRTGCATHTHTMTYTPQVTGTATFALWDPYRRSDNRGDLDITVSRTTPVPEGAGPVDGDVSSYRARARTDHTVVDAADADGAVGDVGYAKGDRVRVRVFGSFTVNDRRTPADAACTATYAGWADLPETGTGQDLFALHVDGAPVTWKAMRYRQWHDWDDTDGACSPEHAYETTVKVTHDGPLRFSVFDLEYRDNSGTVMVETTLD